MQINVSRYEKKTINPYLVKQNYFEKIEPYLTVCMIIFFSDGLNSITPLHRVLVVLSYLLTFYLAARQFRRFIYFATIDPLLIALIGLTSISILWSDAPLSPTLINLIGLIRVTMFGIYFAMRYSLKEQIKIFLWAFSLLIFVTFFVGIIEPHRGIAAASWRGGFPHKNYLARLMVVSIVTFFIAYLASDKKKFFLVVGSLLSFSLVLLTGGATALTQSIFAFLILIPFCKTIRSKYKVRVTLISISIIPLLLMSSWFVMSYETIALETFDRQHSLQGRDDLKTVLVEQFIWEKPLFGHGYVGFWNTQHHEVVEAVGQIQGHRGEAWAPTHAHSGFIDLILFLGFVGLIIFMIGFAIAYYNSIIFIVKSQSVLAYWPFIFLTLFFLSNINVNMTILSSRDLNWILYTSTIISLRYWLNKRVFE